MENLGVPQTPYFFFRQGMSLSWTLVAWLASDLQGTPISTFPVQKF